MTEVSITTPERRVVWLDSYKVKGQKAPYLARLTMSGGAIDRAFAPKIKLNSKGHRQLFRLDAAPGDVFEGRAWRWTGTSHECSIVYAGVQADGALAILTRDEALYAAAMATHRIEGVDGALASDMRPDVPQRAQPDFIGIKIVEA